MPPPDHRAPGPPEAGLPTDEALSAAVQVEDLEELLLRRGGAAPVARAFTGLPERSRAALWYTEVTGLTPDRAAGRLGITPADVSSLHWDAAGVLRHAYRVAAEAWPPGPECAGWTADLGALLRGALPAARADALREHLDTCAHCTAEYLRREDIGHGLRTWVLPVLAGVSPQGRQPLGPARLQPAADRVPGRRPDVPSGSAVVQTPPAPGPGRPGRGVRALVAAGCVAAAAVLVGVGVSWTTGPAPEMDRSSGPDAAPPGAPASRTEAPQAGKEGDGSRARSDAGRTPTAEPAPSAAGGPADPADGSGRDPVPSAAPLADPGGEAQVDGAGGRPLPADGTPPALGAPGQSPAGGGAVAPVPGPAAATVPGVLPGTAPRAMPEPTSGAASGGAAATAPSSTPSATAPGAGVAGTGAPGAGASGTTAPGPTSPGAEPSPPVVAPPAAPSTEPTAQSSAPLDEATEPEVPEPTLLEIPTTPWPTLLEPLPLERPGSP